MFVNDSFKLSSYDITFNSSWDCISNPCSDDTTYYVLVKNSEDEDFKNRGL